MALNITVTEAVDYDLFASFKAVPFIVFFDKNSQTVKLYPYIASNRLYTLVHYFQDPNGDIMFHLLELDHYIKFEAGGFYVGKSLFTN
jgi:thioredoxin-related protein